MRRSAIAAGGAVAAALLPSIGMALAAKPPKANKVTLTSSANIITFGQKDTVSGQVTGGATGGVTVQLQQDSAPFNDSFKNVAGATATTDSAGKFSFTVQPSVSTQYRVVAKTSPPVTSTALTLPVRFKVTLKLSDYTPAKGHRVRFAGTTAPAHDGSLVYIQRRRASGSFHTVARAVLKSAIGNLSTYSKRIRIRSSGVFRARVLHDATHATGTSRAKHAKVH